MAQPGSDSAVGTRFGKFQLLKKLASGGMGEIFLAKQQGPAGFEKILVIKRILQQHLDDPQYVQMFFSETRIAASLNHGNVVHVFDIGEVGEHYYLAMEYVHGRSLKDIVRRANRRKRLVPLAYVVDLIAQACDGLSYAHNLRNAEAQPLHVIHRDINPHNLLVSYEGTLKIIDFGIAKSTMSNNLTQTGTIKGKFAYMSPEQSAAQSLDKRSDVFSLTIVLYELLAGLNPFKHENVVLALEAIQRRNPPPITDYRLDAAPFEPILRRGLAKKREHRYADCMDLREDLLQLLQSEMIPLASRPLTAYLAEMFGDRITADKQVLMDTGSGVSQPLTGSYTTSSRRRGGTGSQSSAVEQTSQPKRLIEVADLVGDRPGIDLSDIRRTMEVAVAEGAEPLQFEEFSPPKSTLEETERHRRGRRSLSPAPQERADTIAIDRALAAEPTRHSMPEQAERAPTEPQLPEQDNRASTEPQPPSQNDRATTVPLLPADKKPAQVEPAPRLSLESTRNAGSSEHGHPDQRPLIGPERFGLAAEEATQAQLAEELVNEISAAEPTQAREAETLAMASPLVTPAWPALSSSSRSTANSTAPGRSASPSGVQVSDIVEVSQIVYPPFPLVRVLAFGGGLIAVITGGIFVMTLMGRMSDSAADAAAPLTPAVASAANRDGGGDGAQPGAATATPDATLLALAPRDRVDAAPADTSGTPDSRPAHAAVPPTPAPGNPARSTPRSPQRQATVEPSAPAPRPVARVLGILSINPGPNLDVVYRGRSSRGVKNQPLRQARGRFNIRGEAGGSVDVTLDYEVHQDRIELRVDSQPWSIVSANGLSVGRCPQSLGPDNRFRLELRQPKWPTPLKIIIFYRPE